MSTNTIIPINYITTNTRGCGNVDQIEIIVTFFTECNLKCTFCGDRYRSVEKCSFDGIKKRRDNVFKILSSIKPKSVTFKVFGGELFQDKYDDSVVEMYDWWFDQISKYCIDNDIDYQFDISTNAVYHNVERVIVLAKKWNIGIRCSFDFDGRFNKLRQKQLFFENVDKYQRANLDVSLAMILTKPLINIVCDSSNDRHDEWNQYYSKYKIAVDYYDPNSLLPEEGIIKTVQKEDVDSYFQPSEDQIGNFILHCIKHYPNVNIVQAIIRSFQHQTKYLHCIHGAAVSQMIYWECCDMKAVTAQLLKNKQCFLCPHYIYCNGSCNRLFYENKNCHLKRAYDYLKTNAEKYYTYFN